MHLVHGDNFLVATRSLIGGTYTVMLWNPATLAHWSGASRLSPVSVYAYRHVNDFLIDEGAGPPGSSRRSCSDCMVNLLLQQFQVFLVGYPVLSELLVILAVIVEHVELSHGVHTLKPDLGRHGA